MKTVIIMRHAKSDWSNSQLADIERPLNQRGEKDAIRMADWLSEKNYAIDMIVSSPATRAILTAQAVSNNCEYDDDLEIWDDLYPGDVSEILSCLQDLPKQINTVLIVGHNPIMEDFAAFLSGEHKQMKTASIAVIDVDVLTWNDLWPDKCNLRTFIKPRML